MDNLKQVVFQIEEDTWRDFKVLAAHQRLAATQMLRLMISQVLADNPDQKEPILFDGAGIKPPGALGHTILAPGTQWVCNGGRWAQIDGET